MATTATLQRRLIRTKEAATYLAMSEWKLRRLIQDGAVPYIQNQDNGPFLIDLRDLDNYIESHKSNGGPELIVRPKPVETATRRLTQGQTRRGA